MICYLWTANKEGLFFSGIVERTEKEMLDLYYHTNIKSLVKEWNRLAQLQLSMGSNILWTYYTI